MTSALGSSEENDLITRRDAIRRVTALLGGVALVGGTSLLTGCRDRDALARGTPFSADDVAFLDELADTILPPTTTPGAKAARTGAFMALMVTDSYDADAQRRFRDGMRTVNKAMREAHDVSFMQATPPQRLALLQRYDREQHTEGEARSARERAAALKRLDAPVQALPSDKKSSDAFLPDQRKENVTGATAVSADPPPHFFRMMKELALLGYFTSEIGCTRARRYVESPGRFEPCVPYAAGDPAWADHA